MKSKILGFLATGLLVAPIQAFAVPVDYTITFTANQGLAPTGGSFTYNSEVPAFSDFFVSWNGIVFDLTSPANSPFPSGSACGFGAGAAQSFALLNLPSTSSCSNTAWAGLTELNNSVAQFGFFTAGGETEYLVIPGFGVSNGTALFSNGTWRIAPVGVPEPGSLALLGLGLAGLGLSRRGKVA